MKTTNNKIKAKLLKFLYIHQDLKRHAAPSRLDVFLPRRFPECEIGFIEFLNASFAKVDRGGQICCPATDVRTFTCFIEMKYIIILKDKHLWTTTVNGVFKVKNSQ